MSTDPTPIAAELINAAARAAYDEHYGAGHFDATTELRREIARDDMAAAAPILLAAADPLLVELVRAARAWRAQFEKPAQSKPPRMAALIAAVDAHAADRGAENGADR